jgi:hypothetical protein
MIVASYCKADDCWVLSVIGIHFHLNKASYEETGRANIIQVVEAGFDLAALLGVKEIFASPLPLCGQEPTEQRARFVPPDRVNVRRVCLENPEEELLWVFALESGELRIKAAWHELFCDIETEGVCSTAIEESVKHLKLPALYFESFREAVMYFADRTLGRP